MLFALAWSITATAAPCQVGDSDGDAIDEMDEERDGDGDGDVCDPDDDNDGVLDAYDECPLLHRRHYSRNMVCAHDTDGDFIKDHVDNCPSFSNPYQGDEDRAGIGDMGDIDLDGNGIADRAEWRPVLGSPPAIDVPDSAGGCNVSSEQLFNLGWLLRR